MATISLNYDEHNPIAQKVIDFVLSIGLFKKDEATADELDAKGWKETLEAFKDIEEGKGTVCNTFEEYLAATRLI